MLTKEMIIDQITVDRDGVLLLREANIYLEDGVEVAKKFHRRVITPLDTINEITEWDRVKKIAVQIHDQECKDKYQEKLDKDKDKDK